MDLQNLENIEEFYIGEDWYANRKKGIYWMQSQMECLLLKM